MIIDKSKLKSSVKHIQFTAPSHFFGEEGEEVLKIPLEDLHEFPQHPFQVKENINFFELKDSIAEHGVVNPILVRPHGQHQYEILAGHRRTLASRLLGLTDIPAIVRELDDEDAVCFMVDSNIQRETLLPSEKAFAYKMKLEALRKRAGRPKKNCAQLEHNKSDHENCDQVDHNKKTRDSLAEHGGDSGAQIQRFIRLTQLCPTLLLWTDQKKIPFLAAVDLSYLPLDQQDLLVRLMEKLHCSLNLAQAKELKQRSETGELREETMTTVLVVPSKQEKKQSLKVNTTKYFPPNTSKAEMEQVIDSLLARWMEEKG